MANRTGQAGGTDHGEIAIDIRNVWKIFGSRADDGFQRDGLSKQQVLERFNAVVGVADIARSGLARYSASLSGSGKSTLVRHINRLLEPTSGEITVDGRDILALSPEDLRAYRNRNISMVFQNFAVLSRCRWKSAVNKSVA